VIIPGDVASVVDVAARLVSVPSPQTEHFEADPSILAYLDDCITPLLEEAGVAVRRDGMGNVLAEVGPPDAEPGLLMMGYAMTHPAAAMLDAYEPRIVDGAHGRALRGRGVCEQKGALAAALWATATAAAELPLARRLVMCVSTAGETGRHTAAEAALEELGGFPPLGLVTVGTGGQLALGHKGRIDVTITIRGRSAHSSTPWAAVDAIAGARAVMGRLDELSLPTTEHPQLGRVTLTTTGIRSWPDATHTVQDEVRLTYDRRLLPGEDAEQAYAAVRESLVDMEPWEVAVTRGPYMLPSEVPTDAAIVGHVQRSLATANLPPAKTVFTHGGLDAGFLNSHACEAIMWGPGDVQEWHTSEEQVPVSELNGAATGYLAVIRSVLVDGR
jgi:acetylornithine deacetylase